MLKKIFSVLLICFCSHLASAQTTFLLIRHGETEWNKIGRIQGQTNTSLNEDGKAQAKQLAIKMAASHPDITHIYSSDLDRAYETALETAKLLNLKVEKRKGLREINHGDAEGLTYPEFFARYTEAKKQRDLAYPNRKEQWDHTFIPGAETYNEILRRAQNELEILAQAHPGEKIAVFAHGRLIRNVIEEILDKEFTQIENCTIAYIEHSSDDKEQPLTFIKVEQLSD